MNMKKIMIKVIHEERHGKKGPMWAHVCYVNEEIYRKFFEVFKIERIDFADFLSRWVKEDFNLDMDFTQKNHIRILKELVIDKYKQLYPHMYYNSVTDNHGWVRVWVSEKMGKELKKYAKDVYRQLFKPT